MAVYIRFGGCCGK